MILNIKNISEHILIRTMILTIFIDGVIQAKLAKGTRDRHHDHTHREGSITRTRTRQEEGNIRQTHGLAPVSNELLRRSPLSLEGKQLRI